MLALIILNQQLILHMYMQEVHHYWVCKIDLANIDYLGRPIENPTIQIDVESLCT